MGYTFMAVIMAFIVFTMFGNFYSRQVDEFNPAAKVFGLMAAVFMGFLYLGLSLQH